MGGGGVGRDAMFMMTQAQNSSILSERRKRGLKKKIEKSLTSLRSDRANYRLHIELGDTYSELEQAGQADKHYSAALDILRRGAINDATRKQMIMLYGKILSVVPEKETAYLSLAQEYVASGQPEKAVRFLLSSAKRAFDQNKGELALACYRQIVAMGKGNPYIMERCAEIYLRAGRKEEAVMQYVEIGDAYAHQEKFLDALDFYKKASALGMENPELTLKIARMYYALEWKENAAGELVRLAEYYEQQQNWADAAKYYQHSLNLDPHNQKSINGRARLASQAVPDMLAMKNEKDILGALDQIEETPEEKPATGMPALHAADEIDTLIDLTLPAETPAARPAAATEADVAELPDPAPVPTTLWQDRLLDLNLEEHFALAAGLDDDADAPDVPNPPAESPPAALDISEFALEETPIELGAEDALTPAPAAQDDLELAAEALVNQVIDMEPAHEPGANLEETPPVAPHEARRQAEARAFEMDAAVGELRQQLQHLEKQLQNTEEEKYFLQEQFTAQISDLKTRETQIQQQCDAAQTERDALQERLEQMFAAHARAREQAEQFDDARYEAMIGKLQQKKQSLQEHLNLLLKQREENGRFLEEELKQLSSTKQRLEQNVAYIQQVKTRIEQRMANELRQAQEQIRALAANANQLEQQLRAKQEAEVELIEQFEKARSEKSALQDQFTETISALTSENEHLEKQLYEVSVTKSQTEKELKKKLHLFHVSHERLKTQFKNSLATKEQELSRTAQQLSAFADEYVKLETALKAIRGERDKLDLMLSKETATRERLQEKLVGVEEQINALEEHGAGLLEQMENELDRQFSEQHDATDEFQARLDELEQLLAQQEREIHGLELV